MTWIADWIRRKRQGDLNWVKDECRHPAHKPPGMIVLRGPHTHICPSCGQTTVLRPNVVWLQPCLN